MSYGGIVFDRTHCPQGHDLRVHGYFFGTNRRCGICNRKARPAAQQRVSAGEEELPGDGAPAAAR